MVSYIQSTFIEQDLVPKIALCENAGTVLWRAHKNPPTTKKREIIESGHMFSSTFVRCNYNIMTVDFIISLHTSACIIILCVSVAQPKTPTNTPIK